MKTGLTFQTLVYVLVAVSSGKPCRTSARVRSVDDARVADGGRVARVGGAGIVEVTQETGFTRRTLAVVVRDAVVADSAVQTRPVDKNNIKISSFLYLGC